MAALIPAALLVASLVLAWWTVATGNVQDGFELAPFLLFPLIAALVASVVMTFLGLLGGAVGGAVLVSRGRRLWLAVLVPLAVGPIGLLAAWPYTFGPERARRLCREEGGLRGEPVAVAGFSDAISGARESWKREVAARLLRGGYLFVEEPAEVARERLRAAGEDGLGDDARSILYFVAARDHQGCARFPGVTVRAEDVAEWRELGLTSGACIAAEAAAQPLARYELRAVRRHQLWPTWVVWYETQLVDLTTGEPAVRLRAFGPSIGEGESFEGALSGNPLRVLSAYLAPRTACGDPDALRAAPEQAAPALADPAARAAARASLPEPIGRIDPRPLRVDAPGAPEVEPLAVADIVQEDVPPLEAATFHAVRDVFRSGVIASRFGAGSPGEGIAVVGPPTSDEERLVIDTGSRMLEVRLRGALPGDPRTLRVHRARRDADGIELLASFVSEGPIESREILRVRFDPEGRPLRVWRAELPPLERPANTVETMLREATPLAAGGLEIVLHHAAAYGAATSRQYRIRLLPVSEARDHRQEDDRRARREQQPGDERLDDG